MLYCPVRDKMLVEDDAPINPCPVRDMMLVETVFFYQHFIPNGTR